MSRLLRAIDARAESLGSFVLSHREAGFRLRSAEGGFGADNDEDALPLTAEQERARREEEAFAAGHAEGRREAELDYEAERDALARLAQSLQVLRPEPANALALLLAETVDRLVREVIGEVDIDGLKLLARAKLAASLIGDATQPARLRVHPDDAAMLAEAKLEVELETDAALARGTVLLETADGWIEDGPAVRLDRLRAELDRMAAAR